MTSFAFDIDVPVRGEWSNVDLLITSVENCFTAMFADVDGCHTLAVVTGELLENAIKYGDWSGGHAVFRLHVSGLDKNASITVENPLPGDGVAVERLFAVLKWLEGFASADEAYRARLLEIASAPPGEGMSGLGLARIAYEANCKLHAEREGNHIRVTAKLVL
jgi:two-component sensor histidine kinase